MYHDDNDDNNYDDNNDNNDDDNDDNNDDGIDDKITLSITNLINFIYRGLLNIVTEDAQWSYDVKGSYPSTQINTAVIKSKVDSNRPKT